MTELTDEQWNEMAHELFESTHRMRPHHTHRRDNMDMRGEPMVLIALRHHADGMTAGDLAEAAHVSTARIATLLNGLEERGLVTRAKDDEDRRRTVVTITEAGTEAVSKLSARRTAHVVAILRELGADDARELVRIAGRLAEIAPNVPSGPEDDLPGRHGGHRGHGDDGECCGRHHHHGPKGEEGEGHGHGHEGAEGERNGHGEKAESADGAHHGHGGKGARRAHEGHGPAGAKRTGEAEAASAESAAPATR